MAISPVVFCFDRRYAPFAAVATASLAASNPYPLQIYWLVRPADAEIARHWQKVVEAPQAPVVIVAVDDSLFAGWRTEGHVSQAAYMRLLIPRLIPGPRAVYLDSDVLVVEDIRELLSADPGSAVLSGAADVRFRDGQKPPFTPPCQDTYVNGGVLLMNLNQMRKDELLRRAVEISRAGGAGVRSHSEWILNAYAQGRKMPMGNRYNFQVQPYAVGKASWLRFVASRQVAIYHFPGLAKPWQKWCSPWIRKTWEDAAKGLPLEESCFNDELGLETALHLARIFDAGGHHRLSSGLRNSIIGALCDCLQQDEDGEALTRAMLSAI